LWYFRICVGEGGIGKVRMEAGKGKDYKKQSKESASIHPVYILCTEHAGSTIHVVH